MNGKSNRRRKNEKMNYADIELEHSSCTTILAPVYIYICVCVYILNGVVLKSIKITLLNKTSAQIIVLCTCGDFTMTPRPPLSITPWGSFPW